MYNNDKTHTSYFVRNHLSNVCVILNKYKYYLGLFFVGILILSVTNVLAENTSGNNSWLASQYKLPNALESEQIATCQDTTIRLIYVIPSSTETLVELIIENPRIGTGPEDVTFLPFQPGKNSTLFGFRSNDILGASRGEVIQGKQRMMLDLPPILDYDVEAVIEIQELQKSIPVPGESLAVVGPWKLSFTPKNEPGQMDSREFNIDKKVEIGDVQVLVQRGHISSTETLIYYKVIDEKGVTTECLGQPTIEYADQVLKEKGRYSVDDNMVLSFPPLSKDTTHISISFPRMISLNGPGALVTIPIGDFLDSEASENAHIPLDYVVEVNTTKICFTYLVMNEDCFSVFYRLADDNQDSNLLLVGLGPIPIKDIIEAIDDKGHLYSAIGTGAVFDRNDSFRLKEQRIDFQGSLDVQASKLFLKINTTGIIGNTFTFDVNITQ